MERAGETDTDRHRDRHRYEDRHRYIHRHREKRGERDNENGERDRERERDRNRQTDRERQDKDKCRQRWSDTQESWLVRLNNAQTVCKSQQITLDKWHRMGVVLRQWPSLWGGICPLSTYCNWAVSRFEQTKTIPL